MLTAPNGKLQSSRARQPARVARASARRRDKQGPAVPSAELALFVATASVVALPAQAADVDGAIDVTVDSVKAVGEAVKSGFTYAKSAAGLLGEQYEKVKPQIDDVIKKASPVVKGAVDEVNKVAVPAVKEATNKGVPIVQNATKELLESSGVDVKGVTQAADSASKTVTTAVDKATPTLNKVTTFLTSSSPETLIKLGVAAVAVYYLTPFALKALVAGLRGYSGEITAASTVDLVTKNDNVAIIDIRPLKEKSVTGVPDVPSSARGRFIELEVAEIDRRLRGQLRSVDVVETQITALEIRALKRVSKGTQILLMDKNGGGTAKSVAKELSKLGFGNVFVIAGGFSGWQASKLQVKPPVPGAKVSSNGIGNILGTISTRKPQPAGKK